MLFKCTFIWKNHKELIKIFLKKFLNVEMESKSVGLEKEDAMNQARWRVGVGEISVLSGVNPPNLIYRDKPGSKLD